MKRNLLFAALAFTAITFVACDDNGGDNNPGTKGPQLPNGGFEDWFVTTSNPVGVQYPYGQASNQFWDTANEGLSVITAQNITSYDESDKRPGTKGTRSAKLTSTFFFGKFAAGNIYSGSFGEIVTQPATGAKVNFGRPFTARPTALKGWYKAAPGTITHSTIPNMTIGSSPDEYQIYIMLTDWDAPHVVNTAVPSTFLDFDADYVIGFGEIGDVVEYTTDPVNTWTQFTIPVVYKSNATPTHIVVVACASKYGDYFTGSTNSVLQVDDFELVY